VDPFDKAGGRKSDGMIRLASATVDDEKANDVALEPSSASEAGTSRSSNIVDAHDVANEEDDQTDIEKNATSNSNNNSDIIDTTTTTTTTKKQMPSKESTKIAFQNHENGSTFLIESFSETDSSYNDSDLSSAATTKSWSKKPSSVLVEIITSIFFIMPMYIIRSICGSHPIIKMIRKRVYHVLFVCLALLFTIWCLAQYQHHQANQMPDTTSLYQTGHICAIEQSSDSINFLTINSIDNIDTTQQVAHCGDCGKCSNPHDMKIYDDTKSTLFEDTLHCSKKSVVQGANAVSECMEERVGFTSECNDCWVDNVMCDVQKCLFVCMWHAMFHPVNDSSSAGQQALNKCTQCDEKRCGPEFLSCAGANRRRSGIMSEFQRDDDDEVCHDVQVGWWQDDDLQRQYKEQEGMI